VVPCYRCTATIERAVKSVAAQTVRPAELILIDDASPDGTAAHLDALREQYGPDWIQIIRLRENGGPASARNAGWEAARQKYVAFLDSDDAWHPRKVELQLAWMEAHPDVSVTGHDAVQLASADEMPVDPGAGEAKPVSKAALYAANRFVTPSVMLRRDIPQRFEPGARYMEDYLLWLEIVECGHAIAKLPHVLAYTFKAPYGEAGLSAQLWNMEKGELGVFSRLRAKGMIVWPLWLTLSGYSLVKFVRRMLMVSAGYTPGGHHMPKPAMVYAGSYLVLTQAMTALLICAGLFGRSELAADIAVVQAATLATFFSFSGNARNLILTLRTPVPREALLAARLVLLLPLGAAAALLCIAVAHVEPLLALVLIARRGVEWISELHLSESELLDKRSVAVANLLLQTALLLMVVVGATFSPDLLIWLLGAWVLIPLVPILGFIASGVGPGMRHLPMASRLMLPHIGSTAVSGVSLYAFRAFVVIIAGKSVAGTLFTAFAIGSFPGSLFANVLGPSISLHEERTRRSHLPRMLWIVLLAYIGFGMAALAAAWLVPGTHGLASGGKLFWLALGLSLLGGALMLIAQRARVRMLASNEGDAVFGADVLMYMSLIAAVPTIYATGRSEGLAALYLINSALALLFYSTAKQGIVDRLGPLTRQVVVFMLGFLVFLPLFVYLGGGVFNPTEAVYDSGGLLAALPLPVSLVGCTIGLVLLGHYEKAGPALWAVLGLFLLMLVSTAVMHGGSAPLEKAKMLLMLQIVLPMFGLVLGASIFREGSQWPIVAASILAAIALTVPAQLLQTVLSGSYTLSHSVGPFAVYQHLQFVPVILTSAFLLVLPHFWLRNPGLARAGLTVLAALMGIYAMSALSVLSMFAIVAGPAIFASARLWKAGDRGALGMALATVIAFGGYGYLSRNSDAFHNKFDFLFPYPDPWVITGHVERGAGVARTLYGGWIIKAEPYETNLLKLALPVYARRGTLTITGRLDEGKIGFLIENIRSNEFVLNVSIDKPGPFEVALDVDLDRDDGHIAVDQLEGPLRGRITEARWSYPANYAEEMTRDKASDTGAGEQALAEERTHVAPQGGRSISDRIRNVQERFSDWRRFGAGVFDSPATMLFGHAAPLPRDQRTSAHNFYIDFAYNFGVLALVPLFLLIAHTAWRLWLYRRTVLGHSDLLVLATVVAFLVLVESNLKVSLRQPYPGIAIYFFWGLLLAWLRHAERVAGAGR
jgi:glycosyltransferase involved in cell wall biosynthesis